MRRQEREISTDSALKILKTGEYGILSTLSSDGQPYGVPLNYAVHADHICFHSASEGHKIENFQFGDRVSFCVVGQTKVIPHKFTTNYESVIVFGQISELSSTQKTEALHALIVKYSPDHIKQGDDYIDAAVDTTRVFSISIDKISGKARS